MSELFIEGLKQHLGDFGVVAVVWWIFSAFARGMPTPKPESSVAYTWMFNSTHFLLNNADKLKESLVARRG